MGGEWDPATTINKSKYTHHFADQKLDSTLRPGDLKAGDLRTVTATFRFDSSLKSAAFTRGDVTTGWDHSQTPDRKSLRQELRTATQRALEATEQRRRALLQAGRYESPSRREQQFVEQQRLAKAKVAQSTQQLQQQYGPEGAAAMEQILGTGRRAAGRPGKATAADVSAVLALPDEVALSGQQLADGEIAGRSAQVQAE